MPDVLIDQAAPAAARQAAAPSIELALQPDHHTAAPDATAHDAAGDAAAGDAAARPARVGGDRRWSGRVAVAASVAAVLFSGVSLYETVLQPAKPTIYLSDAMLLGHRGGPDYDEAVVLPVTIANHGSRAAVVTKIRLAVARQGVPGMRTMGSAYSGDAPRAERLFTAIAVAGHQSAAGGVVFTPTDDGSRIFAPGRYDFCVTIGAEADDDAGIFAWLPGFPPAAFRFSATVPDFDGGQLDAGTVVPVKTAGRSARSCDRFPG